MHYLSVLAASGIVASSVEGPYTRGPLAVYVVVGPATDTRSYITLDEAMKTGAVELREHGDGEVNRVEVTNRSDTYLFLHVGDVIRGGKQDRTIASDVVLPPNAAPLAIDAFCVEQGRWSPDDVSAMAFRANDAMVSGAPLKRTIQADGNQSTVWTRVAETERAVAAYAASRSARLSSSGTYSAVIHHEKLRADRADYVETVLPQVTAHDDALGVVVAIGGRMVGADIYASHDLFAKVARKILDAYAQEAILADVSEETSVATKEHVIRFLEDGAPVRSETLPGAMERQAFHNEGATIFRYRYQKETKPVHTSYIRKR